MSAEGAKHKCMKATLSDLFQNALAWLHVEPYVVVLTR